VKGKKHIKQKPDGKYPEPRVPADSAWADMKDILDQEIPETGQPVYEKIIPLLLKALPAVLLILAGIFLWMIYQDNNSDLSKQITQHTKIDSTIPTKKDVFRSFNSGAAKTANLPKSIIETNETLKPDSVSVLNSIKENFSRKPSMPEHTENAAGKKILKNRFYNQHEKKESDKYEVRESFISSSGIEATRYDEVKSKTRYEINTGSIKNKTPNANLSKEFDLKFPALSYLNSTSFHIDNHLNQAFEKLKVIEIDSGYARKPVRPGDKKMLWKDLHFGLHWNTLIPTGGNKQYFTGADTKQQIYFPLIPGLWISKSFKNKGEILIKASFNQYFGNSARLDSSSFQLPDSVRTRIHTSLNLIKVRGINAGVQYNQFLTKNWSLGIGANVQYQQNALLKSTSTRSGVGILSDSIYSIKGTSNQFKYLNSYFISVSPEISYSFGNMKIGTAAIFSLTSMVRNRNSRPVSGQVFLHWKIK